MAGLVPAIPITFVHRCRTLFSSRATAVPRGDAEPLYRGRRDKLGDDALFMSIQNDRKPL
jgi:hypothetical protein